MGYNTEFEGAFVFSRQLTLDENETIKEARVGSFGEPSLRSYCQWIPVSRGRALQWDGEENFYNYVEWLRYLVDQFFRPWGVKLSGEVGWQGEDRSDRGVIRIRSDGFTVEAFSITKNPCPSCGGSGVSGTVETKTKGFRA